MLRLEARRAVTRRRGQARSLAPVLRNAVTLELPAALERAVHVIAQRACTTPEGVIIEAVHERLAGVRATLDARGPLSVGKGPRFDRLSSSCSDHGAIIPNHVGR